MLRDDVFVSVGRYLFGPFRLQFVTFAEGGGELNTIEPPEGTW
jgi:hypothetical protein